MAVEFYIIYMALTNGLWVCWCSCVGFLAFCHFVCGVHTTLFGLCHLFNVNFTSVNGFHFALSKVPITMMCPVSVVCVRVVLACTSTICAHIKWCIQSESWADCRWMFVQLERIAVYLFFLFTPKTKTYFSVVALLYLRWILFNDKT